MAKWLDKYEQGGLVLKKKTKDNYGKKPNVNDVKVSAGPDFVGDGYTAYNWKSPAWGGQFAMGGSLPGSVGFMYARTQNPAPANGKYTKKTLASAQDGKVLSPDADDRSMLGFNTSDPAFQNVKSNAFVPFDRKDFEGIKQGIAGYMNSPLYMERLSKSIPDAENAKETQQRRLNNLLSIKLNPNTVNEGTHYNSNKNRINLGATDFVDNATLSHEVAHGIVPNITNSYGKQNVFAKAANVIGDVFQPFEQFSNSELEKINRPLSGKITAPNFDYMMARQEEHYKPQGSKASAKTAANETYGDLTGMRQLLLDNGITTEFGQELTPEIFKKAVENKRVINSPAFKRMRLKFKDDDIIKMNNEVAYNDDNAPLDQAQNGKEMSFYQNGLDFKPKSISKKGKKIIKDDMGQWAHPGEVTEIGSPDITMQGVDYPVLGISDTGDTQMMYPDQDYKFDGDKVTEFPMMEKGGWLDKYKAQSGKTAAPYGSLQGDLPEFIVTSSIKDYNIRKLAEQNRETIGPVKPLSEYSPEARRISEEFNKQYQDYSKQREKEFNQKYNRDSWDYHLNKLKNSAFTDWKPYAAAAAIYGAPAISSALGLGYTSAAMSTPMVAGITANHLLGAAAVTHGINKLPETSQSVKTAYNNPTSENIINAINDVGWNALDLAPAVPTLSKIGTEAKGVYNTVATGESALPIAWKSPAVGLSQEASADMFRGLSNANKLSDADRALLLEYQYDSRPFTGRMYGEGLSPLNQTKRDALNNLIKNNELNISNNAILTRRFNPTNQSLGAEFESGRLNLGDRPSSFSAGIGLPNYASGAVDRLVVPNRYAKQMGSNLLANEYGIPSDKTFDLLKGKSKDWAASIGVNPTDMVNAEREVIGTGLDLRRIGRVKNDIGGYDHIVRPKNATFAKYLTEETPLKNAYKLNPKAFKPAEGMMYRGLGKKGMEDAFESGVFRAKQNVEPIIRGPFDFSKQFSKAYFSPKFDVADRYGKGFIAEVPRDVTTWGNRYSARNNWSQIAQEDIPITKGKILQKDWWKGYKEVPRNKMSAPEITRGPINWWESPTFKKNNPNYDPTKPPLNPFPKYTAENVPEGLDPYLVIDDTPDDPFSYTELDEGLPSIGSALGLSNNVNTNVEAIDAIRKGENYVKNWMYNQEIQKRIQQGNLEILSENHPGFYKSKVSDLYTPNSTAAGIEQKMGDLTPISYSEINRIKEANESNPLIDKLSGLYKGLYFPNNNKAFVKYEKGLSNAADLEATAAHETAHNLQYNRLSKKSDFIDNSPQIYSKRETELLQSPFEFPKSETHHNLDEEIHSRIFEIRNRLGLEPDTKFTKDMLPEAMKVSNGLDRFIKDKDAFIKLMNNIWMVAPVAVGVGAAASSSDKKQNGGWLNKYK